MIPRIGQTWIVSRRSGKQRRNVRVVIDAIIRRDRGDFIFSAKNERKGKWYQVYYRTEGTWAAHGRRSCSVRWMLQNMKPALARKIVGLVDRGNKT